MTKITNPDLIAKISQVANSTGNGHIVDLLVSKAVDRAAMLKDESRPQNLGSSRLFGLPDLPDNVEWPRGSSHGGTPALASFIAQFRLEDIPPLSSLELPRHGYLWLFLESTAQSREFLTRGSARVIVLYAGQHTALRTRPIPSDTGVWSLADLTKQSVPLRFEHGFQWDPYEIENEILARKGDAEAMSEAISRLSENILGQIGGRSVDANGDDLRRVAAERLLGMLGQVRLDEQQENALQSVAGEFSLLTYLKPNRRLRFSLGDAYGLCVIGKFSEFAAGDFRNAIGDAFA